MSSLIVESRRADIVESVHRVAVAVVDATGRLLARSGDPGLVTFMRSAAKPFQAMPLVEDAVVDHYDVTDEELALACASHNSEARQVELVGAFLQRLGLDEDDLACGPHAPLSRDLAVVDEAGGPEPASDRAARRPLASNCSGKHAGMLALALHHGWETAGYHCAGHPVQRRIKRTMAERLDMPARKIGEGVDGCGVVTFAVPLHRMAYGFAGLAGGDDPAARTIRRVMVQHPDLVAGRGRLCTEAMSVYEGRLLAKVGADGVYGAGLVDRGVGVALKVEDGHGRAAMVALLAVLSRLGVEPAPDDVLPRFTRIPIQNTRRETVGVLRAAGALSE